MSLHKKLGVLASRFMDTNGDGTGSINQAVNGSVTPVDFKITCPEGVTYELNRAIITVQDTGTFDTGAYGNGVALATGHEIITDRPDRIPRELNVSAQLPIKVNGDWASYMYNIEYLTFGTGDNILVCRYTFTEEGLPIKLGPGDSFIIRINDDLSALSRQHIRIGLTQYPQ